MEEELEETSLRPRTAASRHHHHQRRRAKKPPPPTTNYDDVFGGPPKHAVPFSGVPDDYSEVFGGVSVSCSIPFLDLPTGQMDGWDCASGESGNGVEYGEIFGRCDFSDFAVPYEELFGRGESDEGEIDMHFASSNGRSSVKDGSGPQTIDPSAFIQEFSNEDIIPYLEDENFSVASDETTKEYNTSYNKSSRTRAHELLHTTASVPQPQTGFTFVIEPNNPLSEHLIVSEDVADESSVKPNPKSSVNSQSTSSKEQVSHGVPFLDVADVNLLTRSANLPPPAPKTLINERQRINTFQKSVSVLNFSTDAEQPPLTPQEKPKTILKSDSLPPNFDFVPNLKLDRREKPKLKSRPITFSKSESLPPGFGSELDAMKEAMEFAQARLKTAKELHEKKREGKITELPLKKKHVKEENLENSEGEKPRVLRSISLASNFSKSREFMKLQGGVAATQGTRELEKSGKWRSDEEFHELTSIDQPTKERENKIGITGTEPLVETNSELVQINGLPSTEAGLTGNLNADVNDTENLQLAGKMTGDDDTKASKEDANVILYGEDMENTGEVEDETEGGKGYEMKVGVETEEEDRMKLHEEAKRQRASEELEKERQREKEIEEEQEKERACKLEEEKERALQLEEEKERARKLEEEKERELQMAKEREENERRELQMEKEREEKERRERERIMAEEEERLEGERMKKWEEEESERERLEKEREEKQRTLAEERERERKLEEDRQEEKMKEKEMVRKLEEEKERERKLEEEIEKERERVRKLEEEMEQERERVKKLEEEKQREREMARKLEKEKERERNLEEEIEKDRQRIRKLEEEREWERERFRKLEEERELEREKVRKLEEEREEERERVRKLEEEREKERIERERERKEREKIELEREQKEREKIVKEREQKEMEKKLEEEKEKQRMEKEKEEREKLRRMEREREEKEMAIRLEAETRRLERERAEEKNKMTKLHGEKAKERKTEARKSDDERERERRVKERERKTEGRKSDEDRRKSDEERERERDRRARKGREIENREREREEEERKREREKDRLAVERATQERAERIAIERITAARQRAVENREKEEMNSRGGGGEGFEKRRPKGEEEKKEREGDRNAREARLRAERAAVERATAEARERAIEKAKADAEKERDRLERHKSFNRISSQDHAQEAHFKRTQSDSALSQGHGESALRHKARLERQQRTAERAAKALAEKNRRDIMAQREQSERDRISEHLDAEVKRWSSGKEGNLRALLSTLQYILGQNSGWQSIHLTEVITAADVKKAYRKATLYVHPDKLQQRGASIHQKYICEKVFDLLKEAWNKFNSEER